MLIKNLFKKDIFRPINGVVKAEELDESSVWQELDEFVITRELDKHLRKFLTAYLDTIDNKKNPAVTGKMGVWISGWFGCGKSHFLKVLSYLLKNAVHFFQGQSRSAVEFFEEKIEDAMMLADVKRAVASNTDVILFNIDSKADPRAGREAILGVFLKVLNELQGYDGDHPHIAHMERHLDSRGKLAEFHAAYKELTGDDWVGQRDAYEFNQDQVVEALSKTLGQSQESCTKWIDNAETNFALSVENFCKWVREYLDSKGSDHRLIFLVDEIGQFIGTDGHLMLSLQTIAEDLGSACDGRAWVIVTSQEEIDKVIGELKTAAKNDFSKIQARFPTRLRLSSSNADEVIQARLLAKCDEVVDDLRAVFQEKGDILRHQLTFTDCGMTLKPYRDADDFVVNYPFAPYQFQLVQRIFESIRRVGATGLHLSQGERSTLDAFQSAGKAVATQEVGVLVPLYEFYPSIESFLDTVVKRTIDQAAENASLEPFDVQLLKVLFLIRYVEEMKGTVDNLVTLCLDEIDADRLALRRKIEDSLGRLEKETLINRSGDVYFFLTNEERDVSREIKGVDISDAEQAKLLGELIFEDVLRGQRKHRYPPNKMDFTFARICDMHPVGGRVEGDLVVSVISPLADEYELYADSKCILESAAENGQVLIRLNDNDKLGREIRTYAQTEKYLKTKSDTGLPESAKRILRDNADDNRERRGFLTTLLTEMLDEGAYFVAGQTPKIKATSPGTRLDEALEYLVTNTFNKMGYLKHLHPEPLKEIQAVLRSNDVAQLTLDLTLGESNPQAVDEIRNYVELCAAANKQIVLHDMLEGRYARRPYGWPPEQSLILLARLIVLGEVSIMMDAAVVPIDKVYAAISTSAKWRKITVIKRHTTDPKALQAARALGKDVFSQMGPDGEDALLDFLTGRLRTWQTSLTSYKSLAETGTYPGREEIDEGLTLINALLACNESVKFIERFNGRKDDLLDLCDNYHDLEHFYEHQKPTWDKLRKAHDRFGLNKMELDQDAKAAPAMRRMKEILTAKAPYGLIKDAEGLIKTVEEVNTALVSAKRIEALAEIDKHVGQVNQELDKAGADGKLKSACLDPFGKPRSSAQSQESIAHITQAAQQAEHLFEAALTKIEEAAVPADPQPDVVADDGVDPKPKPIKPHCTIRPADLVTGAYLETSQDVEQFVTGLKAKLDAAVASGQRIRIK
jgi:hypothetical protein